MKKFRFGDAVIGPDGLEAIVLSSNFSDNSEYVVVRDRSGLVHLVRAEDYQLVAKERLELSRTEIWRLERRSISTYIVPKVPSVFRIISAVDDKLQHTMRAEVKYEGSGNFEVISSSVVNHEDGVNVCLRAIETWWNLQPGKAWGEDD